MTFPSARPLDRAEGPLYRQAADLLRAAISGGKFSVGAELPREAALAEGFGVSLITIRHALRELENEGMIRKRPAKTAVVAGGAGLMPGARDLNSLEDIIAATRDARLEIADYAPRRSAEAGRALGLDGRKMLHCLSARLLIADKPLSDISIYFPPDIGRRLGRADFDDVVVFRSVERRLGIRLSGARITVAAELADAALAKKLDYVEGGAVLVNRMLYLDSADRPVEFTIARNRADRYRLSYSFHRES
jgi:GntR family transcriptional regulator